jgi:hypothetical protein
MNRESLHLPAQHPARSVLARICADGNEVLSDYRSMEQAGFKWREGAAPPRLYWQRTTLLHPDLPGYAVTTYPVARTSPAWDKIQLDKFADEIERDRYLQKRIEEQGWAHLTVARSWLYPISESRSLLISEELPRLSYRANLDALYAMDEEVFFQLLNCVAAAELPFEGPPMTAFLTNGKIALYPQSRLKGGIDYFASRLLPYLRPELRSSARKIWTAAVRRLEESWSTCCASPELLERASRSLLPEDHPIANSLPRLLSDRAAFADLESLIENGFCPVERREKNYDGDLLIAGHPELPGYLIKSYPLLGDKISPYRRLEQYCARCERGRLMAAYIKKRGCRYLTVPKKWIYTFGERSISRRAPQGLYLLVVEKMELLPLEEEKRWYCEAGDLWIEELLRAYIAIGGLDCHRENLPVTRDGQIAIIDTEHIGWGQVDRFPSCFGRMVGLEGEMRAKAIWERLSNGSG